VALIAAHLVYCDSAPMSEQPSTQHLPATSHSDAAGLFRMA
jgi:hypothetical protein